jgi:putative ABC transport system permease protein
MLIFAVRTLFSDRGKFLIALIGVIFSFVLVSLQGGLFLGLIRKASVLVDNCEANIWVGRRGVDNVDLAYHIPEVWLNRIRSLPGVRRAEPYVVGYAWVTLRNGEYEGVWVIGCEPVSMLGSPWVFSQGTKQDLHLPNSIAVDELDAWKLGNPNIGDIIEISGNRARVIAKTYGILGFMTTPYVFTTIDSARRYAQVPEGYCSYFLVQTADGSDRRRVCAAIRQLVPNLDVFTSEEFSYKSRQYWVWRTGIGISFGASTALGVLVGLVMVAQTLYAATLDHLSDYATLKAIGAEDGFVYRVLIIQAMVTAVVGTSIGLGIVYLVQALLSTPVAPLVLPIWLLALSMGMVLGICLLSAVLPFQRIRRIDPATVLQE